MKGHQELNDLPLHLGAEGGHAPGENERQLWAAALCLAIADVGRLGREDEATKDKHEASARAWLSSDQTTRGSFLWVCDALDLEPHRLRAAIVAKAAQLTFHDLSNYSVSGRRSYASRRTPHQAA